MNCVPCSGDFLFGLSVGAGLAWFVTFLMFKFPRV